MTLLNPAILTGLLLAGLPVLLHLLMKQKPKKLVFPALQLILSRKKQNLKRMRLRHIWLLLLRILAIGLLVFAISRPSLPAANYGFITREWITLLLVIAGGVAIYFWLLKKWRDRQMPRHQFLAKRAAARGYTTGGVILALLLVLLLPYQQRIAAEIKAPPPNAELDLPVSAILLFDSSLSMGYLQEGQTRLDVAREIATEHMSILPHGSRVAVVDSSNDHPIVFQQTLGAAQSRLAALEPSAVSLPLNERLRAALLAQVEDRKRTLSEQGSVSADAQRDRYLRRVYLFTDLTNSAWRQGGSSLLKNELEELKLLNVFVVDVGELKPRNTAITEVRLSRQQVSVGGTVQVSALLEATSPGSIASTLVPADGVPASEQPADVTIELNLIGGDNQSVNKGRLTVQLQPGTPQWVTFPLLTEVTGPVLHGDVRLIASDPLDFDNVRRFTVQVSQPPRVMVVAPKLTDADEWLAILDPLDQKFDEKFVPLSRFSQEPLEGVDVIQIINVPRLSDADWSRLAEYVENGGGLAIFLGSDQVSPSNYQRGQAAVFLPATPTVHRFLPDQRMSVEKREHPIFQKLDEDGGIPILENDIWIDRYFRVDPAEGSGVMLTLTDPDRSPLMIERVHGKGRTVLFATAVDAAAGPKSRWTNLALPTDVAWPMIGFAESLTLYLARATDNIFNYTAGEEAVLQMEPQLSEQMYLLKRPGFKQSRETLPEGRTLLVIDDVHDVGDYDLTEPPPSSKLIAGFTVNSPSAESQLNRLNEEQLTELFGEDRVQVARSIGELDASVNIADLGREVFPIVLALVVVAFLCEHLVANRFYDADPDAMQFADAAAQRDKGSIKEVASTSQPPPAATTASS